MGGHDLHNAGPKYNNFLVPKACRTQQRLAVAFGAISWFWIMFRCYKDGRAFLGFDYHFGGSRKQEFDLDEFSFYEGDEHLLPDLELKSNHH